MTAGQTPRVAPGDDPWRAHPARIVTLTDEAPGVRTYELVFRERAVGAGYRFAPGQFNMLHLPGIGEAAISVSSDPACTMTIGHTVRAVGNVTDALARLVVGDEVLLRGPFGAPWPMDRLGGRDVVVVAGGLGLASQRAAILQLVGQPGCARVTVLHGAKRPAGLLFAAEYARWRAAGVDVLPIVEEADSAWSGPVGLVTDLLPDAIGDPRAATVLCCGPDAMMAAVAEAAIGLGVLARELFLSLERTMACAVAHCGLCQFGPLFVCRDGPVLRYDRIAEPLKVPHL